MHAEAATASICATTPNGEITPVYPVAITIGPAHSARIVAYMAGCASVRLYADSTITVNAGIVATRHCCSVSERCATAVFVPARLTAQSAHTTRNCGRYSRFGTAHWRRSKTKTGTSATQVQNAVAAEKATGLKLMLNKALVSIVRSTARTTYSKTTRIDAEAKAARLHETTGFGGRASSSSSSAGAPFLRRGARLIAA